MEFTEEYVKKMTLQDLIDLPLEDKARIIDIFGELLCDFGNNTSVYQVFNFCILLQIEEDVVYSMCAQKLYDIKYSADLFVKN
jgi:hypothetical protein